MNKLYQSIYTRKSTRSFSLEKIDDQLERKIKGSLLRTRILFNTNLYAYLVTRKDIYSMLEGFLGKFGIIEAPYYVILANDDTEKGLIDTGFFGEQVVLELTREKLATCWIGSNFSGLAIKKHFNIKASILALIALGKAEDDSPYRDDSDIRRKKVADLIIGEAPKDEFAIIANDIRQAPSALNSQPWRIYFQKSAISLYLDDPSVVRKLILNDLNFMDLGIAAKHLEISLNNLGLDFSWEYKCPKKIKGLSYIISAKLDQQIII